MLALHTGECNRARPEILEVRCRREPSTHRPMTTVISLGMFSIW